MFPTQRAMRDLSQLYAGKNSQLPFLNEEIQEEKENSSQFMQTKIARIKTFHFPNKENFFSAFKTVKSKFSNSVFSKSVVPNHPKEVMKQLIAGTLTHDKLAAFLESHPEMDLFSPQYTYTDLIPNTKITLPSLINLYRYQPENDKHPVLPFVQIEAMSKSIRKYYFKKVENYVQKFMKTNPNPDKREEFYHQVWLPFTEKFYFSKENFQSYLHEHDMILISKFIDKMIETHQLKHDLQKLKAKLAQNGHAENFGTYCSYIDKNFEEMSDHTQQNNLIEISHKIN